MLITSGRCPACKQVGCGGPSDIVPVDPQDQELVMAEGRPTPHRLTFNGRDTVMRLSPEEAKRRGATPLSGAAAAAESPAAVVEERKARAAPQNKQRPAAQNKTAD